MRPIRNSADFRWLRTNARPALLAMWAAMSYGCSAAVTHYRSGVIVALHAGLTQAALSLSATLVLALTLERLVRWPANPRRGFWMAAVVNSMLTASWLVIGHLIAGTSNILVTIAPSLIIGIASNFAYSRILFVEARRNGTSRPRGDDPASKNCVEVST
ncbi:putative membrane protein [Mycobacterium liflandii 128FXT]|uniref:Membrane protein n=2 Tax=Mycobacterium liflandii TaxID=261524 RepID=L7VC96_MYCL1|nr:putative membrane protein [Mycobacterium liflandii 128FXT]